MKIKKTFFLIAIILLCLPLVLNSCKKYEEGPVFSLASKKSRVVNVWKLEKMLVNNTDATSLFLLIAPAYTVEFEKNNTYTITWTQNSEETGVWAFDGARDNLVLTPSHANNISEWRILRLKSNELWAEYHDGNDTMEVHLVSK
jgi:hypothetical protein